MFWFRHHALFGRVHTHDTRFVVLNMVFLAFIAVLPFPTELLGKYGEQTIAVVIYAVNVLILSTLLIALFIYAERNHLVHEDTSGIPHRVRAFSVLIVFGLSIPVAFLFGARTAEYFWLTMFLVPRVIGRVANQ